ncbi:uncharacterized protein LOC142523912 [Primulina tabacum]|uniref:uncharacterized protein LOC142523912 n=1 Tax=Primulina tabacum TaxID=48773 RepID=UPI003F5A244E
MKLEVVQEKEYEEDELQVDKFFMVLSQMEDGQHEVQDPLEEINLGELENPKVGWTWKLVEHRLPLKEGFKPFQQPSRRMSKEVELKVKEEVEKLLKAKFIKPIRYTEWLSNIVPVMKKNGKVRICIDFRDLNCATPKDLYVMPIPDMLIDSVARHELLSFMDGFSGYNQIKIAETDTHKTAFRCPGAVGTFEWLVMPFGLKNAGATYQRAMNLIFRDMIGHHIEVYIDDIVVKSKQAVDHIEHLRKSFQRMRQHELKLNPLKCAFGVKAVIFLGFLVHQRGVEVDKNKAKAIMEANPPRNKKELQRFLGKVNYLRRFISNLAGKTKEFSQLLKLKDSREFEWEKSHQNAFDVIKRYLSNPHVLMPPSWYSNSCQGSSNAQVCPWLHTILRHPKLLDDFEEVSLVHVPRQENWEADELAQVASGLKMSPELTHRLVLIKKKNHPSIQQREIQVDTLNLDINLAGDWRDDIKQIWNSRVPDMFTGSDMKEFAEDYGIKLRNSSPHYPQSNGQAEASNKILIKILQKMRKENPRDWPRLLPEILWAYRTSKRSATGVSPFSLTFGHDAVLPLEIMVPSMRVARQNELSLENYNEAMIMELEELDELRIQAYNAMLLQKQKVARIYNKRVNKKSFHEGEIVWKAILPIGTKDRELGKWIGEHAPRIGDLPRAAGDGERERRGRSDNKERVEGTWGSPRLMTGAGEAIWLLKPACKGKLVMFSLLWLKLSLMLPHVLLQLLSQPVTGEKPEKFTGVDFKRWQQKMMFYLTMLNLARFLSEDAPKLTEGEGDVESVSAVEAWNHYDFLC